ncbi:MAG: N-acetyltransferase [Candidatus Korobacteraceae bacterium]
MFTLRDYRLGDFEELYRIDTDCFEPGIAYSRGELQSYVQRKQSFCIIAEPEAKAAAVESASVAAEAAAGKRKERIAGFVVVELQRQAIGHVITLDVRRDFRRHHLGTLLMQAAEERVRKLGGFMMELETAVNNAAALAFYERHRYKILRRLPRYYAHNLDALFMTKRL